MGFKRTLIKQLNNDLPDLLVMVNISEIFKNNEKNKNFYNEKFSLHCFVVRTRKLPLGVL